MKAILGKKIGMTTYFDAENAIPATVLEVGPCFVSQIKTVGNDGYCSIQIAFGNTKKIKKPQSGHLKKAKITKDLKNIREFRITDDEVKNYQLGQEIKADIFKPGDLIDAEGISKGKGFAGTVKRHNFSTGPKTHGSHNYRKPGSIGATGPQRVLKGTKMAGHMGARKVTAKNIKILEIDLDKNLMFVRGAVPGANTGIVFLKSKSENQVTSPENQNLESQLQKITSQSLSSDNHLSSADKLGSVESSKPNNQKPVEKPQAQNTDNQELK